MNLFSWLAITLVVSTFGTQADEHLLQTRVRRLFKSSQNSRWTNGVVPYIFSDDLPNSKRQEYKEKVFPLYEKYSCIRFVKWTASTSDDYGLDHNNYLIFSNNPGCSSPIGNMRTKGQRIMCCGWRTCLHEIGHAIGMLHEHTSPIRDDFVRINDENIKAGLHSQFDKVTNCVDTFGIYDYDSIMHYGMRAWSDNGEKTIDFLDPDTKPVPKYADTEQYFYFFKEINDAYQCTETKCDWLTCFNGGYKAIINDQCECRCPQGLDPANKCKTLLDQDPPCGDIITLDENTPTVTFRSPEIRNSPLTTCHWYINSPPNSRILLNFPHFKVRRQNGVCKDEVAVKPYLPGMYGTPYCGGMFTKTVQSSSNILAFSLTQAKTDSTVSVFIANVTYVPEESYCYNLADRGSTYYTSTNSFTDDSTPCLYWDSVTNCSHHLFNMQDEESRLEGNYCRNPDNSTGPWCYTSADGCVRRFCDACQLGICKDLSRKCSSYIKDQPNYCTKNSEAPNQCRQSCGFCDNFQPLSSVTETFCDAPFLPLDAAPMSLDSTYRPGDTVRVHCNDSTAYRDMTCQSNGEWTKLEYVCGTCLPGWSAYGNSPMCYRRFGKNLKYGDARNFCAYQHPDAELLEETQDNHNFITDLIKDSKGQCTPVWLGLRRSADSGQYTWRSGETPIWTNWNSGSEPGGDLDCAVIDTNCKWVNKWCGNKPNFVCQYTKPAPFVCKNQRSDCWKIGNRNPDFCTTRPSFALTYCEKYCGLCSA